MRIITKFRDYYDSAVGYGIDKTLIYKREMQNEIHRRYGDVPQALRVDLNDRRLSYPYRRDSMGGTVAATKFGTGAVIFCGKRYPFMRVYVSGTCAKGNHVDETHVFYSLASMLLFFSNWHHYKRLEKDINYKSNRSVFHYRFAGQRFYSKRQLEEFFEEDTQDYTDFLIERGVPAVAYEVVNCWHNVTFNPRLEIYEFYKVVDAFTAFQEIAMFLGGVMTRDAPEMENISDKHMRDAKGFDEWSFKKMPSKNK